jgi:NAD(P)-dependent dehydrogenase (short-subunit alcohol dehydrogenase family)
MVVMKARIAETNPMKRLGHPEDVVGACIFLTSDAAGYVNGAQLPVDGGLYRTL